MLPSINIRALSLVTIIACFGSAIGAKKIFCYYSSFAQTRQSVGNFLPENINPFLCTHIIYAFVDITSDGRDLRPFNRNDQGPNGLYARTLALKLKNPALKILLAVGGWQIGSKPFIPMIKDEATRSTWIKNVVSYVRRHGFDGFDMDWEFPATRGSAPEDKYRFTLLMKGLFEAFAKEAEISGKEKLLLTLAAASGTYYIDQSYEPSKIIHYIDYMLLMSYNYHGQWEKVTGHHSGLYPHKNDPKNGEKAQLYQEWSIDYWLNVGISKDKLIVGLPTYGMTFTLVDQSKHGIHAPSAGAGRMGDYTREMGILSYYEICLNLKSQAWKSEWIEDQQVPFAYGGDQWAGYEDKKSIALKANNILNRDLAGAFVWSVEMDDFGDVCGQGQYPLLSTIVEIIGDRAPNQPAAREAANHYRPRQEVTAERPVTTVTDSKESSNQDSSESTFLLQFKKIKGKFISDSRKKSSSSSALPTFKATEALSSSASASSASSVKGSHNRWWSSEILKYKVKTQEPKAEEKISEKTSVRMSTPKFLWKKYVIRSLPLKIDSDTTPIPKMAHKFPSYEVHEVKSWKTTSWWSDRPDNLRAVSDADALNARATGRPGLGLQREPTPKPTSEAKTTSDSKNIIEPFHSVVGEKGSLPIDCRSLGLGTFADPRSCDHFIICLGGNWMNFPPHVMACPTGTRFDRNLKICNYASNVRCIENIDV
ncbi:acidic mammalian chitinase [Biomphalaria glabrata]|nr:acidic mammalian chitinase-like [Biomphalaria glabrata]